MLGPCTSISGIRSRSPRKSPRTSLCASPCCACLSSCFAIRQAMPKCSPTPACIAVEHSASARSAAITSPAPITAGSLGVTAGASASPRSVTAHNCPRARRWTVTRCSKNTASSSLSLGISLRLNDRRCMRSKNLVRRSGVRRPSSSKSTPTTNVRSKTDSIPSTTNSCTPHRVSLLYRPSSSARRCPWSKSHGAASTTSSSAARRTKIRRWPTSVRVRASAQRDPGIKARTNS